MKTYNSFNELAASQNTSPCVSQMSVFNMTPGQAKNKVLEEFWNDPKLNVCIDNCGRGLTLKRVQPNDPVVGMYPTPGEEPLKAGDLFAHEDGDIMVLKSQEDLKHAFWQGINMLTLWAYTAHLYDLNEKNKNDPNYDVENDPNAYSDTNAWKKDWGVQPAEDWDEFSFTDPDEQQFLRDISGDFPPEDDD